MRKKFIFNVASAHFVFLNDSPLRIDFNGRVEKFLAEHLGGRAEEFNEVEGATAQFPLLEMEAAAM